MKKMTPKQKKILDISITCLEIAIVLIAIIISAIVIANPITSSAQVGEGKIKLLPVLSDSMDGNLENSFAEGDLVVAKTPDDIYALKVNDIITYTGSVNGYESLITHRIVEVVYDESGKASTYYTKGDKYATTTASVAVNPKDVLAVYSYHLKGVGSAINWLQEDTHFLLVIVLPLIALFIYNIVMFVRMLMQNKMEKLQETAASNGAVNAVDEEEIKRKAIEEYLAKQNAVKPEDKKKE